MTLPEIHDREIAAFCRYLFDSVDGIVECLEGLDAQQLNWRPPAASANSLYVLAVHTMANVEEAILQVLCDQPVARDRDAEFVAAGPSAGALRDRWSALREAVWTGLAALPPTFLDQEYVHPRRGPMPGREVLLVTTRHAAEHWGHAELTRDLLLAKEK
jgi:hypothetical protein